MCISWFDKNHSMLTLRLKCTPWQSVWLGLVSSNRNRNFIIYQHANEIHETTYMTRLLCKYWSMWSFPYWSDGVSVLLPIAVVLKKCTGKWRLHHVTFKQNSEAFVLRGVCGIFLSCLLTFDIIFTLFLSQKVSRACVVSRTELIQFWLMPKSLGTSTHRWSSILNERNM